jgi:polar amino acid transport system substrate-binding protein
MLAHAADEPPRLHLMTEPKVASSLHGASPSGLDAEKVAEIMARAGIAYTVEALPWKRAFAAARRRADACLFSTTRTPEREELFTWIGPLDYAEWVLMGRADRNLRLRSLEDARPYRIGTYDGDARDQYLRARGFDVDPAPNDLLNPRKLMANRIDFWAASLRRGSAALAGMGYAAKIVPVLTFNHIQVYLACNRAVPDALVARMGAALESMEHDGTLERIVHRYDDVGVAAPRR